MKIIDLLLIALALSMDAFAVAVIKGVQMKKLNYKQGLVIAAFFGVFQGGMPLIGWALGSQFKSYIESFDHWVAFILLTLIGGKMIYEVIKDKGEEQKEESNNFSIGNLILLSIATSVDALVVGITFAFLDINIIQSAFVIGILTFIVAFIGVIIGNKFGAKYKKRAELIGGIILVLMGVQILVEHLLAK